MLPPRSAARFFTSGKKTKNYVARYANPGLCTTNFLAFRKRKLSFREKEKGLCDDQDYFQRSLIAAIVESRQLRASRDDLQQALQDNFSLIQQKEQELEQVRGDHRKITKELDKVQQTLEDLRKLQVTKERVEYKSIQDPGAMQELQAAAVQDRS